MQVMVKDSMKYAATGGLGFAEFKDGKPSDEALHKTCFPCHEPAKTQDFIYPSTHVEDRRGCKESDSKRKRGQT